MFHLKPSVLNAFGWNIIFILSCDWLENQEKVLNEIEKKLQIA